jgi:hypothetical protein
MEPRNGEQLGAEAFCPQIVAACPDTGPVPRLESALFRIDTSCAARPVDGSGHLTLQYINTSVGTY